MSELLTGEALVALLILTSLEMILGIDNIIFTWADCSWSSRQHVKSITRFSPLGMNMISQSPKRVCRPC